MSDLKRIKSNEGFRREWGVQGDAGAVILALYPNGEPLGVVVHSAVELDKKGCEPHEGCEYLPGGCWMVTAGPAYAVAMISVAAGSEADLYTMIEGFYSSLADLR